MVKTIPFGGLGSRTNLVAAVLRGRAYSAWAPLKGDPENRTVRGRVEFYDVPGGSLVVAEVYGLPFDVGSCKEKVFALHIHEGGSCTGTEKDPFADTKGHYNPEDCEHPQHAGDLPPLFGNGGHAWQSFFTNRFRPADVVGHTVVIHGGADDFTTQPAGNAGAKIACGEIRRG